MKSWVDAQLDDPKVARAAFEETFKEYTAAVAERDHLKSQLQTARADALREAYEVARRVAHDWPRSASMVSAALSKFVRDGKCAGNELGDCNHGDSNDGLGGKTPKPSQGTALECRRKARFDVWINVHDGCAIPIGHVPHIAEYVARRERCEHPGCTPTHYFPAPLLAERLAPVLAGLHYADGDSESGPTGDVCCKVCNAVVKDDDTCSASCPIDGLRRLAKELGAT